MNTLTLSTQCVLVGVGILGLVACGPEEVEYEPPVRAIKTYTVSRVASGRVRRYSGIVRAADYTALSFAVPGNVKTVEVDLGDTVREGQVLATLDAEPFELDVTAAQAELERSQIQQKERKTNYDRYKHLLREGVSSQAEYDRALRSFESARSEVSISLSRLNLSKRDLTDTVLRAPYDGTIGWKQVEPHMEVTAGQKLLQMNAEGAIEVQLNVPEATINYVALNMPSTVTFPTLAGVELQGILSQVGTVATTANAYPVVVTLIDPPDTVRSGMTAEIQLVIGSGAREDSMLVPLSALAASPEPRTAHVFRYDEASSTVQKVFVRAQEGVDNWVAVTEGVEYGDVIAVAGVHFLVDGQKVKLLRP